ncbi:hypothetical protein [Staphylococcus auricularis]|uniref:hypothetical protein n=1 Tax=Staphylococcus auricularis TaxID=29379 RepID=UPI00242D64C7|nr:hypothetical protein [Staphylococcus auricularis]
MEFLVTQTTFSFSTMIITVLNILLFILAIYLIYRVIKHFNTIERIDKNLTQLVKMQQQKNADYNVHEKAHQATSTMASDQRKNE